MVCMQLELGISATEREVLVPLVQGVRDKCRQLYRSVPSAWNEMKDAVQAETDLAMVQEAVGLCRADRARHPTGGVLLVADTERHAERLVRMCGEHGVRTGGFDSLEAPHAGEFGIVVVTKAMDRGYNSAVRLGALVTGVYPGNAASRHQMVGRLRRIGQTRDRIEIVTVLMKGTILELLHRRHRTTDSTNLSLQQFAQSFTCEELEGIIL